MLCDAIALFVLCNLCSALYIILVYTASSLPLSSHDLTFFKFLIHLKLFFKAEVQICSSYGFVLL